MWLTQNNHDSEFEKLDKTGLAEVLRTFYASARTQDGKVYSKSAMVNLRAGINRYLVSPPLNRDINLVSNDAFFEANKVFSGVFRELCPQDAEHHQSLFLNDVVQMYESGILSTNNPLSLQRKVFFEINLHFPCIHGREALRELQSDSFLIKTDRTGRRYLALVEDCSKQHQGGASKENLNIMYEWRGHRLCPLASFELYLSKLNPAIKALFQTPDIRRFNTRGWYMAKPVGKNALAEYMKHISIDAKLSLPYTNYAMKYTSVAVYSAMMERVL